uniref:FATC domain-containing protein n=1 Tax=Rhizochromulina marina TaxID=1034831 RepID=A0A7S2RTQ2_9STRA
MRAARDSAQALQLQKQRSNDEERNSQALEVLARVQCRLQGHLAKPDLLADAFTGREATHKIGHEEPATANHRSSGTTDLTIKEHVSWMIKQATNPDHLCLMYEGWAPWL